MYSTTLHLRFRRSSISSINQSGLGLWSVCSGSQAYRHDQLTRLDSSTVQASRSRCRHSGTALSVPDSSTVQAICPEGLSLLPTTSLRVYRAPTTSVGRSKPAITVLPAILTGSVYTAPWSSILGDCRRIGTVVVDSSRVECGDACAYKRHGCSATCSRMTQRWGRSCGS